MNYVGQLQTYLEGFVTTEARVAATVVLTLAAIVAAIILMPRVVRTASQSLKYLVFNHDRVPVDPPELDWQLPLTALVRTLQLTVFIATLLAILVTWGYVDIAIAAAATMATWVPLLFRALATLGLVGGTLVAIEMLDTTVEQYAEESDALNQHQQGIVFRVLQVVVLLGAGVAALSVWGIGLGNLLVGAGFVGIVIGTAARSTIGSLIAGFVLMFARPFEIGDWVEIDDKEGIITDITIINTRMRNAAGEEVVIPNDNVANATVTNRTSLERLRLSVDVGVDYNTDVERAEAIIQDVLENVSHVVSNPTPQVVPKSLGDSAVVLECRFWIDHPSAARRAMATAAVVREVKQALDENDIKIPFPQRELTGREEAGGFHVTGETAGPTRAPGDRVEQSNGQ